MNGLRLLFVRADEETEQRIEIRFSPVRDGNQTNLF